MLHLIAILTHAWLFATPAAGAATTATTTATAPTAPTADIVVDDVQKFYASIGQVTAQFRQNVMNSTFGTQKSSDGTVWLMKPGKMRWDYLEKKKDQVQVQKSFISNGTTLYVVDHGNKQVVKKDLKQDLMPVAVTFLYGKGNLKAEFTAAIESPSKYGDPKTDIVLKLTPKQPSAQYKSLRLVVAKTDFHVRESIITDSSDNVNHFEFFGPDFTKAIKDTWFEFDERSVKNYRVIDADQQQAAGSGSAAAPSAPSAPKKP